jgi:hypothetical protein
VPVCGTSVDYAAMRASAPTCAPSRGHRAVTSSPLPRRLPVTVPPAHLETFASYLSRLATLNAIEGDELWRQAATPAIPAGWYSGPSPPPLPLHPAPVLDRVARHQPPRPPPLDDCPDIVAAQRRHLRLVRRYGWAAAYDAVLTSFVICAHLWENGLNVELDPDNAPLGLVLKRAIWTMRTMVFIHREPSRRPSPPPSCSPPSTPTRSTSPN